MCLTGTAEVPLGAIYMDQGLTQNHRTARRSSFLATFMMVSAGVQCPGLSLVLDRDCRGTIGGHVHGPDPGRRAAAHQDGRLWPLLQN